MHPAKHDRMEEDMVIEMEEAPPKEKRQKKKQVTRKPLCTFVNYLGNTNNSNGSPTEPKIEEVAEEEDKDEDVEMDMEVSSFGGVSSELKKLSLDHNSLDDSSTTSIETVNTSNKSMDAMVRDDRFNFDAATPAVHRWMDPPPPLAKDDDDELGQGLYITSRCESDSDSEEDMDKPREIVFRRKRTRCPRIHRWQNRQTNVRALPIRGNINALPKIKVRP